MKNGVNWIGAAYKDDRNSIIHAKERNEYNGWFLLEYGMHDYSFADRSLSTY